MNKNSITRAFHKVGFKIKKHSPEILIVAGVGGVVASTVLACKATTKVGAILEEAQEKIDAIHQVVEDEANVGEYTEEDTNKAIAVVYTRTAGKLIKLYAPAVALGALSLTAIITSNNILRKRNIALAAAYTAVDKGFKSYRGRVIERFGEELDKELKYNIKSKEVEEIVTDENGEEKAVSAVVPVAESLDCSPYAKFFDEYCSGWSKDADYNLMFLRQQQNYANDLLQSQGYLFLNTVYEMLGIPKTEAGQIVGWIYDKNNPDIDNFVDFGIYNVYDDTKRRFVNGYEKSILLDFNVDGNILDCL